MRILVGLLMMVFLTAGTALAATVNLTDGRSVQGTIVKQDNKSIQLSVDGVNMTYYADEIKDVDGHSLSASLPSRQGPLPTPVAVVSQPVAGQLPAAAVNSTGVIDQEKKDLILKFIDVFGTRQALVNNFDMMLAQIAKEKPEEADKIRQRIKVDEIIERLLPIYDRNFSKEDLKAFIAFYGSAEGQKLIGTIPELMKESIQESVKYMEEKFPEVKRGQ